MLYYAYGSNMDWAQMRERCPSARFIGVAKLPGFRLAFTRKSVQRNCGVADAVQEAERNVWGVVYQLSELELGVLDKCEGFRSERSKNSYWRRECMVFLDGEDERPVTVETYFAEVQPDPPKPNRVYKDLLLKGAQHWHLPADYMSELQAIEVSG